MNAILLAVIFTVAVVADFFWDHLIKKIPSESSAKRFKLILGIALLGIGWFQAYLQYRKDADSDRDNKNLFTAVTNSSATIVSMQSELTKLRNRTDEDFVAQMDVVLSSIIPNKSRASFAVGRFAMMTGRANQAEHYFRNCLQEEPSYSPARNNLGVILRARGDTNAAREQFKLAIEADPSNGAAALNYAKVLMTEGAFVQAQDVLANAQFVEGMAHGDVVYLSLASISAGKTTNVFQHLERYVKTQGEAEPAMATLILLGCWNALTPEQKSSVSNWPAHFAGTNQQVFAEGIKQVQTAYQSGFTNFSFQFRK